MNQQVFLDAIATWAATLAGIAHAQVYESETNWQAGGEGGFGGLTFDVPALFVHAPDARVTDHNTGFDWDNEITLVLFTAGDDRRADARTLVATILNGLRGQRYGLTKELADRPRLDGTITDITPDIFEGQGLCVYAITYRQAFRDTPATHAFSKRY